jgi:16S rRNA (guanine527-N7)-methyltransferase
VENKSDPTLRDLRERLAAGAGDLGLALSGAQFDALLTLLGELGDWSGRFNLTAIRNPADMLTKHVLDSLSIHAHLRGDAVADVGTGAGFPGLPLAVVDPQRRFTLIEATAKKARFVEHAVARLALANVEVVNQRAERYRPTAAFDSVVTRALGELAEFVRLAGHLCAPDGWLLAMKGKSPESEINRLPRGWRVAALRRLHVPGLDAERHLVALARSNPPHHPVSRKRR